MQIKLVVFLAVHVKTEAASCSPADSVEAEEWRDGRSISIDPDGTKQISN